MHSTVRMLMKRHFVRTLGAALLAFAGVVCTAAELPSGWFKAGSRPSEYEAGTEPNATSTGAPAMYMKSIVVKTTGFGTIMTTIPAGSYLGQRVRLSAFVRTRDVNERAGLWMRVDREGGGSVSFDNMQDRPIKGTSDWTTYEVVLDVPPSSGTINFGLLLRGTGEVWLAGVGLDRVSTQVPVTDLRRLRPNTPQNLDFEN